METKQVYTLDEVCEMLHVTRRTMYTYIKSGKIKAVKVGRNWHIAQEAINELLGINKK